MKHTGDSLVIISPSMDQTLNLGDP